MFLKSSWLPDRVPFTILTLPLFWFVLSISPNLLPWRSLWVLFIVHGLLYGAVHAYINFYDSYTARAKGYNEIKLNIAIAVHSVAILLGFVFVNITFAALVLFYGLIAYASGLSNLSSRSNIPAWLFIRFVQGFGATLIYYIGLNDLPIENVLQAKVLVPGIVSTMVLVSFFPGPNPAAKVQRFTQPVHHRIDLLILCGVVSVWYFSEYISSTYSLGVITAFGIGILLQIQQHYISNQEAQHQSQIRNSHWIHWVSSFMLNGYAFYIFTDYTQIFQLVP